MRASSPAVSAGSYSRASPATASPSPRRKRSTAAATSRSNSSSPAPRSAPSRWNIRARASRSRSPVRAAVWSTSASIRRRNSASPPSSIAGGPRLSRARGGGAVLHQLEVAVDVGGELERVALGDHDHHVGEGGARLLGNAAAPEVLENVLPPERLE